MSIPSLQELRKDHDLLIFDLDGTILDSMNVWYEVDRLFLQKRGIELTDEYTEFVKNASIEQGAEYTVSRYGLKETPGQVIDEWNDMVRRAYRDEISLKNGAYDYLRSASSLGFTLAFATALTADNAANALRNNGVLDLFGIRVTLADIDSSFNKGDPDIYLKAAELSGIAPVRSIVYEDILLAIRGAASGGFKTCAVYDPIGAGNDDTWRRMCALADYCVQDFRNA